MRTIEIRTFEGCQTAQSLIEDLQEMENKENFQLKVTTVPSAEQAAEMGLFGSPTILVNGVEYQKDNDGNPGFY